ncbi:MAG: hypothetical protein RIT03_766 [Bacteroidota bacterium]|jgi:hypothetical protein
MKKQLLLLSLFAMNVLVAQVPSYVPTTGLVGYWPFNGNANDQSGNGNNGTLMNGVLLTSDRFNNLNSAYSFDGIDDFIQVPNSNSISIIGDITISAWVKTNGYNNQNYQTIVSKRETYWTWEYAVAYSYHTNIIHNTKFLASRALGMGNQEQGWSTTPYNQNSWENWVVTISNNQMKLYKNGILDHTQVYSLVPVNQVCPLLFGKNTLADNTNSEQFYGKIDDIGIWNRALTQEEITGLYNASSPNECQTLVINTGILSFNPVTYTNTVTIYPNPANDHITIDCGNLANVAGWNIKISNTLGQEVFSGAMNTPEYVVPLNSWGGQGLYFVRIYDAQNNLVNTKKIILQ